MAYHVRSLENMKMTIQIRNSSSHEHAPRKKNKKSKCQKEKKCPVESRSDLYSVSDLSTSDTTSTEFFQNEETEERWPQKDGSRSPSFPVSDLNVPTMLSPPLPPDKTTDSNFQPVSIKQEPLWDESLLSSVGFSVCPLKTGHGIADIDERRTDTVDILSGFSSEDITVRQEKDFQADENNVVCTMKVGTNLDCNIGGQEVTVKREQDIDSDASDQIMVKVNREGFDSDISSQVITVKKEQDLDMTSYVKEQTAGSATGGNVQDKAEKLGSFIKTEPCSEFELEYVDYITNHRSVTYPARMRLPTVSTRTGSKMVWNYIYTVAGDKAAETETSRKTDSVKLSANDKGTKSEVRLGPEFESTGNTEGMKTSLLSSKSYLTSQTLSEEIKMEPDEFEVKMEVDSPDDIVQYYDATHHMLSLQSCNDAGEQDLGTHQTEIRTATRKPSLCMSDINKCNSQKDLGRTKPGFGGKCGEFILCVKDSGIDSGNVMGAYAVDIPNDAVQKRGDVGYAVQFDSSDSTSVQSLHCSRGEQDWSIDYPATRMATSEANPSEVGMDDLKLDPGTVEPGTGRRVAWDNIQSDRMRQQKPSSTIPLSVDLHKSTRNPPNNLQNSALTTSKPLSRLQNPPGIPSSQPCISHQNPLNKPLISANSIGRTSSSLQCMPSIIRSSNNLQSLSVIPVSRPCSRMLPNPLANNCSRMSSSVQGISSNVITQTSGHQNVFENPTSRAHSGSCQNPLTDSLSSVKNLSSDIFKLSSGPENLITSSTNKLCSSSLQSPSLGSPCRMPSSVQIPSSSVNGQSSSLQNLSFNPYSRSHSGRLQNSAIDIGSIPSILQDVFHKTVSKPCRNSSAITATKSPVCYHNMLDNPVIKPSNPQHSSTSKPFKSMCQSRLVFPFNITVSSFQNSTPRISIPPSSFQNSIPNVDKLYNDLQNPIPQNSKPCHSHPDLARCISKPTNSLRHPSPYNEMPPKNLYKSTSNSDILSNCLQNPAYGIDKQSDCIQNLPPDNARPTNSLQNLVPYNKKPCDSLQNPSHDIVKPCNRLQNSVLNNDKLLYSLQNSTSNIKPSCSHQNPLPISIRFSSDGNPTQSIGKLSNSFQNPATSTGRPPSNLHNTTPPSSLHNPTPPSDDSSNSPQNLSSDTPSQPKHVCGVCRVVFDTDVRCIQHIKTKHMQNRDLPWHCSVLPLKTMKNQPLTHTLGAGQPVTVRFSNSGQGRMGTESGQNLDAQSRPLLKTVMTKTLEQPPANAQQTNTVTQSMFRPAVKGIIRGTKEQFPVSMQKTMIQNMSERSAENKSETRHVLETKRVAQNTSSRVAINSLQNRDAQQTNTVSGCMPGGQTENDVYSRVVQETEMVIQSMPTKPLENSTQTSQQQFETCTRPGFKRRQNPESVIDSEWEVSTSPQKQNPDDVNNSKLEIIISPKQKTKKAESVTCQFCPEQFCDDLKYFEHLQLIHDKMDWYSCTSCQQFFTDVDRHLRVDRKLHQIQKVNNLCVQCNQSFSNTNAFRAHVKLHSKNEALKCEECNMMFTHACTFAVHQKSHKLGKDHMCDICGKSFRLAKYLSFHLRNHTGERPFPCDLCEKSFSNSSNLAAHRRTHTGEKPYVCNICQQAFTTSSGLHRPQVAACRLQTL